MRTGAVAGFKYFDWTEPGSALSVTVRGTGVLEIVPDSPDGDALAEIAADAPQWSVYRAEFPEITGVHALYFRVKTGRLDFSEFAF